MKSFLVIGLGRFGIHLTHKLMELGNEVMVVDQDEERVAKLASVATAACVGDCQDEQVLASLGVRNFDVCFVCVSDDFQTSLEATATLKDLGARCVVARADREKQIKYNEEHHITPHSVKRAINESAYVFKSKSGVEVVQRTGSSSVSGRESSPADLIAELTKDMLEAADNLEFERAAYLRDQIKELKKRK